MARVHGATRWQHYDWRRRLAAGELAVWAEAAAAPVFAALMVEVPEPAAAKPAGGSRKTRRAGVRELVVQGVVLRAEAEVGEEQLVRAIRAVRAEMA